MSTSLWDRRLPRISYQVPVAIQPIGEQRRLSATSVNLSAGGIFVDTDELLAIGSPIVLKLPLMQQPEGFEVRGSVAWLRPIWQADEHRPRGMGIRFVDVDASACRVLETLVGTRVEDSHPVVLEVDGSRQRIQARAHLTGEGIFLRTPLPFLQLGSDVRFSFNDDDQRTNYRGRIAQVSLNTADDSSVPRLQVEVELTSIGDEAPAVQEAPQITWRREIEVDLPDRKPPVRRRHAAGSSPPAARRSESDDDATTLPSVPGIDPAPAEPAAVERPVYETTERTHRRVRPLAVAGAVAVGAGLALGLALVLGGTGGERPSARETAGAVAELDAEGAEEREDDFIAEAAAERVRRAAAEVRAGRASAGTASRRGADGNEPATRPTRAADLSRGGRPAVGVPVVRSDGGHTEVSFRYAGSVNGMTDYVLDDPDAVAVNLPNARPLDELGSHWIRADGVRLLWVRERLGGMHVRLFFSDERRPHSVTAVDGVLTLRFQR